MLQQQQQQFILTGWHFRLKSRSKGKSKPCERRKTVSLYLKLFLASVFICCGARRLAIYCCWCIQWSQRLKFLTSELFPSRGKKAAAGCHVRRAPRARGAFGNTCGARRPFVFLRLQRRRSSGARQATVRSPEKKGFSLITVKFLLNARSIPDIFWGAKRRERCVCVCVCEGCVYTLDCEQQVFAPPPLAGCRPTQDQPIHGNKAAKVAGSP